MPDQLKGHFQVRKDNSYSHKAGALTVAQAGVEGYTATLAWGAGFFVVGAVLAAFLIPNAPLAPSEGEPVIAH
ncbi:hypothetical protein OIE52_37770 [Streptomyces canus]|uniref:hypothetical protein n=1 Tax=Streptomyces canus TaxID=58343 RepID=UPI0030DF68D6